jgi:hypothetical protein
LSHWICFGIPEKLLLYMDISRTKLQHIVKLCRLEEADGHTCNKSHCKLTGEMSFLSTQDHRTSLELDGKSGFYHPSSTVNSFPIVNLSFFQPKNFGNFCQKKTCFPSINSINFVYFYKFIKWNLKNSDHDHHLLVRERMIAFTLRNVQWLWWSVSSVSTFWGMFTRCYLWTVYISYFGELRKKTLSQGRGRREPFHDESLACYHHCPWLQRDMRHCSLVIAITNEIALPIYRKSFPNKIN